MKIKLLVLTMTTFFSVQSFAGLLIDPYFGVGQAKSSSDLSTGDESNSSTSVGSRLGYSFLLLSAGIDYEMSNSSYDGDDVSATNMSLFVGVDLPILLRGWAEYYMSSSYDIDGVTQDIDFKDGYGIGIGFTGLPFVSLNLEVSTLNYEVDVLSGIDYSVASTMLSISLPLDL